ncbi:MAG: type IVB secretion system apparatus protein IcmL/DotI [Legionella sp.]|nr:type IVB secretion system apparatus protein IcmL/DotI [Legionella sp.]
MAEDALVTVGLRNKFYKDSQRKVILALLIAIIINLIMGSILLYILTHPPMPKYFATSINGRITPLVPLNEPNQSTAAILQWANQAAIAAFSYNFVNYRDELQAAAGYFTDAGWTQFKQSLKDSNIISAVTTKKLILSAVATQAPIVMESGVLNGVYSWRVQMPILVTYQSASQFTPENYIVTLLITRVSTLSTFRGIGIAQIVVMPSSGGVIP